MAGEQTVINVRELSEYLRVNQATIYRLVRAGRLPAFRVGSNWRFNAHDIEKWEKRVDLTKVETLPERRHAAGMIEPPLPRNRDRST
jgi:excisionase family DNA binding protein